MIALADDFPGIVSDCEIPADAEITDAAADALAAILLAAAEADEAQVGQAGDGGQTE
jgi:hypothetical protein